MRVSGNVARRTRMVNKMMAKPIWLKQMTYNTSKVLSIGRMMNSVQRKLMASKCLYPLPAKCWSFTLIILGVKAPHTPKLGAPYVKSPYRAVLGPHEHRFL